MRKYIVALMLNVLFFCGTAHAESTVAEKTKTPDVRGILGLELSGAKLEFIDGANVLFEDTYTTFSVAAGVKIDDAVSVTGFYQLSTEQEKDFGYLTTTGQFSAYGTDIDFYIPVAKKVDLTAGIGIGVYDFEVASNFYLLNGNEEHIGVRYQVGAELHVAENLSLTSKFRYTDFADYDEYTDAVKEMHEIVVGMKFYF